MIYKETKKFNSIPLFPFKMSSDFDKKNECYSIIKNWRMTFQVSDAKVDNFLIY